MEEKNVEKQFYIRSCNMVMPSSDQPVPNGQISRRKRAFTSRLGYNSDNWKELQNQVLRKARVYPSTYKRTDQYGDRYEQQMVIYGPSGKLANVVVAWIVSNGTTKMTSMYVKEAKIE